MSINIKHVESIRSRFWDLRHSVKQLLLSPKSTLEAYIYASLYSRVCNIQQASLELNSLVMTSTPFMIARLGSVESRLSHEYAFNSARYSHVTYKQCHNNAGIFPAIDDQITRVAEAHIKGLLNVDVLGFWPAPGQHELVTKYCTNATLVKLSDLEPWRAIEHQLPPWSRFLAGKTVLVVHPFIYSISRQYQNRECVFPYTDILPSFNLILLRPPVTHCGLTDGYVSWNYAFQELEDRVLSQAFDVALIACGSYGLPLASSIKNNGRQAIHMGGSLQLLFGILGRRWERDATISTLINKHWTRPLPVERPEGASSIDGGSYW